jgi:hypothetical protein
MKWEIKYRDNWKEAKKLAGEGWELVGVSCNSVVSEYYYYFKPPL